jgi:cystathionine beta-lyase/cystathionine gamma-synthase
MVKVKYKLIQYVSLYLIEFPKNPYQRFVDVPEMSTAI